MKLNVEENEAESSSFSSTFNFFFKYGSSSNGQHVVVWMKAVTFRRSFMLSHSCSCSVALWATAAFLLLRRGGRTVEHALGTGPVWHG